jgi:hypothetical protein
MVAAQVEGATRPTFKELDHGRMDVFAASGRKK